MILFPRGGNCSGDKLGEWVRRLGLGNKTGLRHTARPILQGGLRFVGKEDPIVTPVEPSIGRRVAPQPLAVR